MKPAAGRMRRLKRCAVLVLLVPAALFGESLPRIEGENLAGKTVVLPNAASRRMAILIAGITHASQHQTKPWDERWRHEFPDPSKVTVYPAAVLRAIPARLAQRSGDEAGGRIRAAG